MLSPEEIESLTQEHKAAPHIRILQKRLAQEVTILTHGSEELEAAEEASAILFGKGTMESLKKINEKTFLAVFEGVPQHEISTKFIQEGEPLVSLLTEKTGIFPSRGELKRLVNGGGLSLNKEKISDLELIVDNKFLLNKRYILVQKGKKNYFLIVIK